ncbi:hypothetical protein V8E36_000010 [Tilletia maclaganii]
MPRHSKRNTASASFTYAERQMTNDIYGSHAARLSAHSVRAFDMCSLCLAAARNPVVCPEGHLFCKECILDSLLTQSKDIAAQKIHLAQLDADEQAARERAREQARARMLRQFEDEQSGVRRRAEVEAAPSLVAAESAPVPAELPTERAKESSRIAEDERALVHPSKAPAGDDDTTDAVLVPGQKSSSNSLSSLPEAIALKLQQAEDAALASLEQEQRDARRTKLPAFWLPSLTPSEVAGRPKDIKLHTLCRVGNERGHKLKMKNLIEVKFTRLKEDESGKQQTICPSCKKGLGTASKLYVVRSCGDVICSRCVDTILKPAFPAAAPSTSASLSTDKAEMLPPCPACDVPLASSTVLDQAVLELEREGTGYAAGGQAEVKKQRVVFQG